MGHFASGLVPRVQNRCDNESVRWGQIRYRIRSGLRNSLQMGLNGMGSSQGKGEKFVAERPRSEIWNAVREMSWFERASSFEPFLWVMVNIGGCGHCWACFQLRGWRSLSICKPKQGVCTRRTRDTGLEGGVNEGLPKFSDLQKMWGHKVFWAILGHFCNW